MITVTFGTAAPDGSVIVPAKADVPADCPITRGAQIANNKVKIATQASREQSSVLDFIIHFSFKSLIINTLRRRRAKASNRSCVFWDGVQAN
jgi:hypothetical protein